MSTTTRPRITTDELEDVRWLAREALAEQVLSFDGGQSPMDGLVATRGVLEAAWAVGACGTDLSYHDEDEVCWPVHLDAPHAAAILSTAAFLEGMLASFAGDAAKLGDEGRRSFYQRGLERLQRASAVLGRVS